MRSLRAAGRGQAADGGAFEDLLTSTFVLRYFYVYGASNVPLVCFRS
jgi:hypothetical protein